MKKTQLLITLERDTLRKLYVLPKEEYPYLTDFVETAFKDWVDEKYARRNGRGGGKYNRIGETLI